MILMLVIRPHYDDTANMTDIPQPDDAADALAVAICHLHSARIRSLGELSD